MSGSPPPSPIPAATEKKITVLIVDDIPETRENLRKLLFFEPDIEVIGAATDGHEGVQLAQELAPDVVLMDINMPGMDGIAASQMITRRSPYTQIIIMSVQSESDYLRRSMLAGAREFLTKPFSGAELVNSIHKVYQLVENQRDRRPQAEGPTGFTGTLEPPEPEESGKIVSIFSPKGGVGCSTLAVNLAIAAHKITSAKVAVVDGSLQFGDISVLLNERSRTTIADLAPHADELDIELINSVLVSHNSGIKALLAPPKPEMADLVTPKAMTQILERLRRIFDLVIVDTYSTLQDIVISILDASDRIVLVTTPEIPSIKSAKLFFEVTDALEYPSEKTHLILNKYDRRIGIKASDIKGAVKHEVMAELPLDERTVITAVNQGVPYVLGVGGSDLAKATAAYAKRLYQDLSKPVKVAG
ncbi:MAG TPA: MinD/ParA family protein [Chloroflexi bacterium]|nr:MinD/ParA family protein [Chloroflexota bacterium]